MQQSHWWHNNEPVEESNRFLEYWWARQASTELLWLALWSGNERRIMILTDKEMANRLLKRFQGCPFPHQIEIIHYNPSIKEFETMGIL